MLSMKAGGMRQFNVAWPETCGNAVLLAYPIYPITATDR
jgi:hypothetical protein